MTKTPFGKSEIAKKLASYKMPRYNELTSFPVVMRQLVGILYNYLSIFCVPNEERLVTQPMINSYVHNKIILPPTNKEYEKHHIVHLLVIGILKTVLSIPDIGLLIDMQMKQYPLEVAYNYFCDEVDEVLNVTFGSRSFAELKNTPNVITPLSESIHSAIIAFANKIYTKQHIYYEQMNKN